jgi:thiol-disulfide isomerase/thioredoxin
MSAKIKIIIGIAILVLMFSAAKYLYSSFVDIYEANKKVQVEENFTNQDKDNYSAPDFTVYDREGNKVNLSDFAGKPVVLNFWASWCPPCRSEMPDFDKVYGEVKSDVVFMMVNLTDGKRETQASGQRFVNSKGFTVPVYFDNDGQAANAYVISSIPATFLIKPDGGINGKYIGAIDEETLRNAISILLE